METNEIDAKRVLAQLAERLRRARLDADLTQRSLAERVGVSLKTVRNAEDGQNISLETLILLLQGIGRVNEIENLLRSAGPSPIRLAERLGRERQRASGARHKAGHVADTWEW